MKFVIGDLVTRKSYKHDVLFRIANISQKKAILHGEYIRLKADAPIRDIEKTEVRELKRWQKKSKSKEEFSYRLFKQDYQLLEEKREFELTDGYTKKIDYFRLPTKVLHLDGDEHYLKKCIELYERLGLMVHGLHIREQEMAHEIGTLLEKIQPDIVVLTGHDAYLANKGDKKDLRAYRHSKYFKKPSEMRAMSFLMLMISLFLLGLANLISNHLFVLGQILPALLVEGIYMPLILCILLLKLLTHLLLKRLIYMMSLEIR